MRTLLRLSLAVAVVAAVGIGIVGCTEEEDASRIVVDITNLNSNSPLFSDVFNQNNTPTNPDDDFIPIDVVPVTFQARPHDSALTLSPNGPFGSVRFTKYRVEFTDGIHSGGADLDGDGTLDLKNFDAPMNLVVDVNDEATAFILIIGGGVKSVSPLSDLRSGGEYDANARLTFFGQEETSGDHLTLNRGLTIRIANFGDTKK